MNDAQTVQDDNILDIGNEGNQYLTFLMANEEYGVDILRVQEIRGWESVTTIPNTPEYIKGVINIRGTIVPIVDLRTRFKMKVAEYGQTTVVIVLKVVDETKERVMGIVVDAVADVYNVDQRQVKDPPDFGSIINIEFVRGLATIEDKMLILLEIDKLLNQSQFIQLDNAKDS